MAGILDIIGALTNANRVSGGLQTMPDGTVSYTPATAAHPGWDKFLTGGEGKDKADKLNLAIMGPEYLQSRSDARTAEREKMVQELRNKGAAETTRMTVRGANKQERIRGQNQIANTEAQGEQARLNASKALQLDILKSKQLPATPENIAYAEGEASRIMRARDLIESKQRLKAQKNLGPDVETEMRSNLLAKSAENEQKRKLGAGDITETDTGRLRLGTIPESESTRSTRYDEMGFPISSEQHRSWSNIPNPAGAPSGLRAIPAEQPGQTEFSEDPGTPVQQSDPLSLIKKIEEFGRTLSTTPSASTNLSGVAPSLGTTNTPPANVQTMPTTGGTTRLSGIPAMGGLGISPNSSALGQILSTPGGLQSLLSVMKSSLRPQF